jgi:hypothetical protein
MHSTISLLPSIAAVLAGTLLLAAGLGWAAENEATVVLKGEIEPSDYDDDGEVRAVSIYDDEWGDVLISLEGKGKALLEHVGAVAEVRGTIRELDDDSGYPYVIRVTAYEIHEPAEPEDYPDWEPEEED